MVQLAQVLLERAKGGSKVGREKGIFAVRFSTALRGSEALLGGLSTQLIIDNIISGTGPSRLVISCPEL